ncbi:MAG: Crp/Fnr family transcriptional regulator [Leptolyngbya sp. SIO1E4]|nr:Crp/Fnr family transcriptional regulator [Leptolyngbya sp. SIO1E4]
MSLPDKASHPCSPLAVLTSFRRKESLPLIRDRVWRIETGIVRTLTWNEQGHVTTFGLWGRGDIVGQCLTQIQPYQLECLTSVVANDVPLGSHGGYWQDALLKHLWRSEELLRIIHQPSVAERLIQLLYWLAQRFGKSVPQGYLLEPLLTHQQLAEIISAGRVTVTRLLAALENQGQLVRPSRVAGKGPSFSASRRAILLPHQPYSSLQAD